MFNYSTQETPSYETSPVTWLERSTLRETTPEKPHCSCKVLMSQTNKHFPLFNSETIYCFTWLALRLPAFPILTSVTARRCQLPPQLGSSPRSSLLTVLYSKAPKTMKYCADLIENSFHIVKLTISQTYVIPAKIDCLKHCGNLIKMDWQPGELLSVLQWEESVFDFSWGESFTSPAALLI